MSELRDKFKSEIEQADWDMLEPHHLKQTVFILADELDLIVVGEALAKDDTELVSLWLGNKSLQKPSDKQVKFFNENPYKKICDFLIIQPFVLAKLFPENLKN
jgi:hypothetical protein